jgi:predicted GH43/DUF377 family glycosyl hydrolase
LNIGKNDMRIASIAIVVTRNVRDFNRIPGLMIDDWSQTLALTPPRTTSDSVIARSNIGCANTGNPVPISFSLRFRATFTPLLLLKAQVI